MSTLPQISLTARLQTAKRAALAAGHVIMAHYGHHLTVSTKSSQADLVTQVDLECDELIREILAEDMPGEVIITEETYQEGQGFDLSNAWVVDPLDGTTNYAHGFPHFAVSIAFVEAGEPKVAVVFDPFKNELFTAVDGEEALRNGISIHVSDVQTLDRSLLATGFPYEREDQGPLNSSIDLHTRFLKVAHGTRRAGAAALDLAYVACGRLDGFWELHLSPWDVAAGILLIKQAGGVVSGFSGEPLPLNQRRINIVGSNAKLQEAMIQVTSGR